MRISELSRRADVPVATIKFYLREQLLHDGQLTSPTQAQYDESHVARLRLVRSLLGAGGLSVATAKDVLRHLDDPPASTHDLLGVAQAAITPAADPDLDLTEVRRLLAGWGWVVDEKDCDTQAALAVALRALDAADFTLPDGALDAYAQTMRALAEGELDGVPTHSATAAVRYVVLGTILVEPLLLALRRLAQQDASAHRFA